MRTLASLATMWRLRTRWHRWESRPLRTSLTISNDAKVDFLETINTTYLFCLNVRERVNVRLSTHSGQRIATSSSVLMWRQNKNKNIWLIHLCASLSTIGSGVVDACCILTAETTCLMLAISCSGDASASFFLLEIQPISSSRLEFTSWISTPRARQLGKQTTSSGSSQAVDVQRNQSSVYEYR